MNLTQNCVKFIAFCVEKDGERQPASAVPQSTAQRDPCVPGDQKPIGYRYFIDKFLNIGGGIDSNADKLYSWRTLCHGVEVRHFLHTRGAPGRPEVGQQRFANEGAEGHGLTLQIGHRSVEKLARAAVLRGPLRRTGGNRLVGLRRALRGGAPGAEAGGSDCCQPAGTEDERSLFHARMIAPSDATHQPAALLRREVHSGRTLYNAGRRLAMHLHILGICGTFMGGLALIARAAGHRVTGCDAGVYPPMSTQLEEQGIGLIEGFGADQLALKPDLFIVGNVVSRGNPLMEAILDAGLAYTSGPQWLGEQVLLGQHVLAVAGTHGKTTTSAMLAWILEAQGRRPNFLIGGVAHDLRVSARFSPDSREFVIEADEYDTAFFDKRSKFVHYRPRTAVLNNLEFDHADIFPDLSAIETQFHHLVRTVPGSGLIVVPDADPALERVLTRGCWSRVQRVGQAGGLQGLPIDSGTFEVRDASGTAGRVRWSLTGDHNRHNALAALAAARDVGVPLAAGIEALCRFAGVRRRMEIRGVAAGVTVYDDFAHHPTAIRTTLDGLRARVGGARILAVLEPRSNTMKLGTMAARLAHALDPADLVYCFGQHEGKHALGWDPAVVLAPLGARVRTHGDLDALIADITRDARVGDHILIMSNGGFGGVHTRLLNMLGATSAQARVPQ